LYFSRSVISLAICGATPPSWAWPNASRSPLSDRNLPSGPCRPSETTIEHHWAVSDYLQRSARHIASAVDAEQAYKLGVAAVKLALEGRNAVMPTVIRLSDQPYRWKLGVAELKNVANVEKKMPRDFITEDGFHITAKCRRYLAPLIKGEDYPAYRDGLPDYVKLKNVLVPKKLGTAFKI
jgi:ATP-dependent phosphofructokinase / diphosphate-dependent phosphofructokinase